jgi:hypothetical protein
MPWIECVSHTESLVAYMNNFTNLDWTNQEMYYFEPCQVGCSIPRNVCQQRGEYLKR